MAICILLRFLLLFQSTRLSRASTTVYKGQTYTEVFQSTRLSRASTQTCYFGYTIKPFQSTRLSRASTTFTQYPTNERSISIHKALTSLDLEMEILQYLEMISIHKALTSLDVLEDRDEWAKTISIHKALTSLDIIKINNVFIEINFNPQGSHEPRRQVPERWVETYKNFNPQGSHEPRQACIKLCQLSSLFQSTRLSRASTAKIHNYPCIHAKFIYLNYTPSTNHPASQKIFSYFNPIFRPFAVRIPLEFYVQLLFAPEFPY